MDSDPAILELRIEIDRESVSGEVVSSAGSARRFSGYAGLIAALQSLRSREIDAVDPDRAAPGPEVSAR